VDLEALFDPIDLYLFDQILRRRIAPGARIFDAGCGVGRNLVYLLRAGYEVFGADSDEEVIGEVRACAARLAPASRPRTSVPSTAAKARQQRTL
jgi:tellurite methyltransferase